MLDVYRSVFIYIYSRTTTLDDSFIDQHLGIRILGLIVPHLLLSNERERKVFELNKQISLTKNSISTLNFLYATFSPTSRRINERLSQINNYLKLNYTIFTSPKDINNVVEEYS